MYELNVDSDESHTPTHAGRSFSHAVPKHRVPVEGMVSDAAYQLVVSTWIEPHADRLARETLAKNLIDQDEYLGSVIGMSRCRGAARP